MNQWLRRHLIAAGYDVSAALDACADDFATLSPDDRRKVIRTGLRSLLAVVAKGAKLTIPNGHTIQLPLFAAVLDGDRWVRVSYLLADRGQLQQLVARETERTKRTSERLRRMRKDLAMYDRHPELPNLEAVWREEHVEFRLEEAA